MRIRASVLGCLLATFIVLYSCASPKAIGDFADSAQKTLAGGPALFKDIHDSCIRRESARIDNPLLPVFLPPGSKNAAPKEVPAAAACAPLEKQTAGLTKVSDVLIAYFKAMQKLAGFDVGPVTADNASAASSAATAAGLGLVQVDSASQLANLITRVLTEAHQRGKLLLYLRSAEPQVANITEGLDSVMKNYLIFLDEEQQTVTARYQDVYDLNNKPTLLLLNRAYTEDMAGIQHRREEAKAYQNALKDIREGDQKLLQDAQKLNPKELSAALQPYTSNLNGLLPALQSSK